VTGGTSGLGRPMADARLQAGATVALTSRDVSRAEAVAASSREAEMVAAALGRPRRARS
jgi:NAD(P)-dependent dehydrogenase (short-subunit alcohol dehydrogenase family)